MLHKAQRRVKNVVFSDKKVLIVKCLRDPLDLSKLSITYLNVCVVVGSYHLTGKESPITETTYIRARRLLLMENIYKIITYFLMLQINVTSVNR